MHNHETRPKPRGPLQDPPSAPRVGTHQTIENRGTQDRRPPTRAQQRLSKNHVARLLCDKLWQMPELVPQFHCWSLWTCVNCQRIEDTRIVCILFMQPSLLNERKCAEGFDVWWNWTGVACHAVALNWWGNLEVGWRGNLEVGMRGQLEAGLWGRLETGYQSNKEGGLWQGMVCTLYD